MRNAETNQVESGRSSCPFCWRASSVWFRKRIFSVWFRRKVFPFDYVERIFMIDFVVGFFRLLWRILRCTKHSWKTCGCFVGLINTGMCYAAIDFLGLTPCVSVSRTITSTTLYTVKSHLHCKMHCNTLSGPFSMIIFFLNELELDFPRVILF